VALNVVTTLTWGTTLRPLPVTSRRFDRPRRPCFPPADQPATCARLAFALCSHPSAFPPLGTPLYCFIYKSRYVIRDHYIGHNGRSALNSLSFVRLPKAVLLLTGCRSSFVYSWIDFTLSRSVFVRQTAVRGKASVCGVPLQQRPSSVVYWRLPPDIRVYRRV
jgi:hypothetical protein